MKVLICISVVVAVFALIFWVSYCDESWREEREKDPNYWMWP
jgi:hypothetical protein